MGPRTHDRHGWIVAAACAAVAASPPAFRERCRARLLDLVHRDRGGAATEAVAARTRELENRIRVLEVALEKSRLALEEAGAARDVLARRQSARVVHAEASRLAGPSDLVRRLLLDRGARDGLVRGQPVLSGGGLVGLVATAGQGRAEVRLVTDPLFRARATASRAAIDGLLEGTGGPLLVFRPAPLAGLADPGRALAPGDTIVASRASSLCDLEVVLGVVRAVDRAPGDLVARALVEPAVDLEHVERVLVVVEGAVLAKAPPPLAPEAHVRPAVPVPPPPREVEEPDDAPEPATPAKEAAPAAVEPGK